MKRAVLALLLSLPWVVARGQTGEPPVGYDFDQPQLVANLPHKLREISGLGLTANGTELLAVQDELGKFFRLRSSDGKVLGETSFWKDADYEGIEFVNGDVWIVKSTGTLYRVRRPGQANQEVTKFNGPLSSENDVEGLGYDPAENRLLLACKSHVAASIEVRSIFAFDLASETFGPRPVFSIGRFAMQAYLNKCPKTRKHHKITAFINEREKYELGPSAVAVHPRTGQIFVTSSPGKLIIVLTRDGKIQHVRKLDKDFFPQPEGMVFHPDGTLYISTESKDDDPARIYRLPYQPGFSGL